MRLLYLLLSMVCFSTMARDHIPMEIADSGHMVVEVVLNDSIKTKFIIDTGAGAAVVPQAIFDKLNVPSDAVSSVNVQGANGVVEATLFTLDKLQAGNSVVKNLTSVVQKGYNLPGVDGELGILPQNFLNQFLVEFDLSSNQFGLHTPESEVASLYSDENFIEVPLTFNRGSFIEFPIEVAGKEMHGHLDSGAGNHVLMTWKAANKIGIKESDDNVKVITQSRGASGEPFDIKGTGQPEDIRLGGGVLKNVGINIADLPVFDQFPWTDGVVGNLGIGVFKGKRVLIDYKRKLLSFTR